MHLLVLDQFHRRRFIAVDAIVAHAAKVLVVVRPAEEGPRVHLAVGLGALEGAQLAAGFQIPNDKGDTLVRLGRPCDKEVLARRKVDELHAAVVDLEQLLPARAAPQHDAEAVEGREVRAAWRP